MAPAVSMTTFMDFIVASGTRKISCVHRAKEQYKRGYHPSRDFYKLLRERIVHMHQRGEPITALDELLQGLTDPKKIASYPKCIAGYDKCIARKTVAWIACGPKTWKASGLEVRVNPELGLTIDGVPHVVKLYFKADPLNQSAVEPMLRLIDLSVPEELKGATAAVIDVQRGRLLTHRGAKRDIDALLAAEAASFAILWKAIE
jgi:hypothetical protein